MARAFAITGLLGLSLFLAPGCATVREAEAPCESTASNEIGAVFLAYERYRDEGLDAGLIRDSRVALERARWVLYGENGLPGDETCERREQRRPGWRELNEDFETAELLVRELETIRGVRFVKIRETRVVWVDATTGEEIPPDVAQSI